MYLKYGALKSSHLDVCVDTVKVIILDNSSQCGSLSRQLTGGEQKNNFTFLGIWHQNCYDETIKLHYRKRLQYP